MKEINVEVAESLEEGKTYHVIVGSEPMTASENDVDRTRSLLNCEFPKFNWLVTDSRIKIGDKSNYIIKEKAKEVVNKLKPLIEGRFVDKKPLNEREKAIIVSVLFHIKEELKKEFGLK